MRRRLHLFSLSLFLIALLYDLVVWGAVPVLDEVGASIAGSARREAPLAATYIALGAPLDEAVPLLQSLGRSRLTAALSESFDRIGEDKTVAMDLVLGPAWNNQHRWIKTMYWAPPGLLLLTFVLWLRRPRPVRTLADR
ncbi:hypothetical protein [Dokdonella ginsengisoli]|uniref:Uncharacterized protein n=1 Tax=Dokdonella ginsengisoli TaxID=363846 RepID=A0ABV9QQW2_9GAMM